MTIPPPKVTSQHLARKAVVYLRQSSAKQVHENLQSQRLQYALREQAITWGFRDVKLLTKIWVPARHWARECATDSPSCWEGWR